MYTKIHDNTIITKFVSYLLERTPVPLIPFYTSTTNTVAGGLYIYKEGLYQAKKSLKASEIEDNPLTNSKDFHYLSPFVPNYPYLNLTTTLTKTAPDYDPLTHKHLGDYLRAIKGFYEIDLMPFYNCFNGVYLDDVDIICSQSNSNKIISYSLKDREPGYKILSIPIQFGQPYSIYVDSSLGFDYCPVIYGKNTIVESISNQLLKDLPEYSYKYNRCRKASFSTPFIINPIEITRETLRQYASSLRLLIKLPADNISSFVILEGNYKDLPKRNLGENPFSYNLPSIVEGPRDNEPRDKNVSVYTWAQKTSQKLGPLKLGWFNDGQTYAFTDTLPQYLLLNVISSMDDIDKNIARVQQYVSSDAYKTIYGKGFDLTYTPGIWSDELRDYLFNTIMTNDRVRPNIRLDITGYVDKITEQTIIRGQKL